MSSSVSNKLAQKSGSGKNAKQVRLRLVYVDFWSVMKISFLVSVAAAVAGLVATFLAWTVLDTTGVLNQIDEFFATIAGGPEKFDLFSFLALDKVMAFAVIAGILNIISGTVLGAIAALLYNFMVKITGGLVVGFINK